jgi:predicted RNase H-like HicB family nuclease
VKKTRVTSLTFLNLRYCSAFGDTEEEALHEVLNVKQAWLEVAKAEGKPVPEPRYRPAIYQVAF